MTTNTTQITLRFSHVSEHSLGAVQTVRGFVPLLRLIPLFDSLDLDANPRSSRISIVTDAIDDTLRTTPQLFPFKSKGLLVGVMEHRKLDRNRYEMKVLNRKIEGILDGGHNSLSLIRFILEHAGATPNELRSRKTWAENKELWRQYSSEITALKASPAANDSNHPLQVLVPFELVVPADDFEDAEGSDFESALIEICSARNNNAQLKIESRAGKSGLFDYLKSIMPEPYKSNIGWKVNEGGAVSVANVIPLVWIALNKALSDHRDADDRIIEQVSGPRIYSARASCMATFERLMEGKDVVEDGGEHNKVVVDQGIKSALDVSVRLLPAYDYVYGNIRDAYNQATSGRWGRISAVSGMNPDNRRSLPRLPFSREETQTANPEGFIVPFVYGLGALLLKDAEGRLSWKIDPVEFLEEHLPQYVELVASMLSAHGFDPQKFGKQAGVYSLAEFVVQTLSARSE